MDKNAAYPVAVETLNSDKTLVEQTELRQSKYLNNGIEQDYRNIK
ncbi:DDE-type integrase/transposase/recombinase [Phormidium tenue FACHB-886]|nr:DDE-type integrase/transposase/recombinase [Phormidium tenue FACHB-886]